ncbi:hypothetical protein ACGEMM_19075 [Pseudomonas aeruginosa]
MSSTQLIEKCATRLRGIVEALNNIHDTSPHRWSTDLDDVHSSAESLLAMIKDQAPARSEASFEEWLANELEGEDGQPVPTAVCDIVLARRAFNHWPKLEQPAKVGGVRFSAGVSSRLVVEAAQRLYEFESTPEKEAERIERLQAFREQLDPLNLAPHAKAFNEAPAEALKSEQAEAERPEVVATVKTKSFGRVCDVASPDVLYSHCSVGDELMTVSQHERIVGELRADAQRWREQFDCMQLQRDHHRERADAALARVAELERVLRVVVNAADHGSWPTTVMHGIEKVREVLAGSAPPVKAQPEETPGEILAAKLIETWVAKHGKPAPWSKIVEITALATNMPNDERDRLLALDDDVDAQAQHSVPRAWLDVQAERRRHVEVEGWTPEHDDAHSHGQIARAAACYALAGSSAPNDGTAALLVSLAWPWDEQWWKPSTARRDMVKACALGLAEIERLDRVAASQGGPSDA